MVEMSSLHNGSFIEGSFVGRTEGYGDSWLGYQKPIQYDRNRSKSSDKSIG